MICLSFGNKDRKLLDEVIEKHDFIELRLDLCDFTDKELKHYISKIKRSIISFKGDENAAIPKLIKGIDYGASIVDVDIKYSPDSIHYLLKCAYNFHTYILLSYHDYLYQPFLKDIKKIHKSIMSLEPDLIKMVYTCNNFNDYFILLEFIKYINENKNNIATVFALGKFSKLSRVVAEFLNMPIVYTSLNEQYQTIDNQISYDNLKTIMEILK